MHALTDVGVAHYSKGATVGFDSVDRVVPGVAGDRLLDGVS